MLLLRNILFSFLLISLSLPSYAKSDLRDALEGGVGEEPQELIFLELSQNIQSHPTPPLAKVDSVTQENIWDKFEFPLETLVKDVYPEESQSKNIQNTSSEKNSHSHAYADENPIFSTYPPLKNKDNFFNILDKLSYDTDFHHSHYLDADGYPLDGRIEQNNCFNVKEDEIYDFIDYLYESVSEKKYKVVSKEKGNKCTFNIKLNEPFKNRDLGFKNRYQKKECLVMAGRENSKNKCYLKTIYPAPCNKFL